MKCKEAEVLIMEYFDGILLKEKLDLLMEHLANCPKCKEEFDSLKAVLEAVESLPELEPENCFTKNVMASIGKRSWKFKAERYLSSLMWAAALFAFMIFTRDFFATSINGLANSSTLNGFGNASILTGIGNIFTDLPGKFSYLVEKALYVRTVLLSEYLTIVILLLVTFVLSNLALGKLVFGKASNRMTV